MLPPVLEAAAMDWNAAIEKNREALKRVLAMLVAMAEVGLGGRFTFFPQEGAAASRPALEKSKLSPTLTLPRHLHRFVLGLLRPAEAAARRLIIVAARGVVIRLRRSKPAIPRKPGRAGRPQARGPRVPLLPLLDRLSPWSVRARPVRAGGVPRISVPGYSEPFPVRLPSADDPVDATRLAIRLQTLAAALDDLPGQAKRFARWRARAMGNATRPQDPPAPRGEGRGVGVLRNQRVAATAAPPRSGRLWPLRPGRPPGWRRKPVHEVHEILDVVHGLAHWVLTSPDTS